MPERAELAKYSLIVAPFEALFPEAASQARSNHFATPPDKPHVTGASLKLWVDNVTGIYQRRAEHGMRYHANSGLLDALTTGSENTNIIVTTSLPAAIVHSAVNTVARPGDAAQLKDLTRNGYLHVIPYQDGDAFPLTDVLMKTGGSPSETIVFVQRSQNADRLLAEGFSVASINEQNALKVMRPAQAPTTGAEFAELHK